MSSIRIINEAGEEEVRNIVSREATVEPVDREGFKPAVVQRVEYDDVGKMSQITTVCGETENRRESDEKPDITIEGILVEDQLDAFKNLKKGQEITLVTDIDSGIVEVERGTIEQRSNLVEFIPNGGEPQLAFAFQLQLKKP